VGLSDLLAPVDPEDLLDLERQRRRSGLSDPVAQPALLDQPDPRDPSGPLFRAHSTRPPRLRPCTTQARSG